MLYTPPYHKLVLVLLFIIGYCSKKVNKVDKNEIKYEIIRFKG